MAENQTTAPGTWQEMGPDLGLFDESGRLLGCVYPSGSRFRAVRRTEQGEEIELHRSLASSDEARAAVESFYQTAPAGPLAPIDESQQAENRTDAAEANPVEPPAPAAETPSSGDVARADIEQGFILLGERRLQVGQAIALGMSLGDAVDKMVTPGELGNRWYVTLSPTGASIFYDDVCVGEVHQTGVDSFEALVKPEPAKQADPLKVSVRDNVGDAAFDLASFFRAAIGRGEFGA